jgi:hypothetical protein
MNTKAKWIRLIEKEKDIDKKKKVREEEEKNHYFLFCSV